MSRIKGFDFSIFDLLSFYQKLKTNNIEPVVTLYHWDLPATLDELGGWINPEMANYFDEYANFCFSQFGALVKYWVTINEPYIHCYGGYGAGIHAPGFKQSGTMTYMCLYTLTLAHAKAYHSYNASFRSSQNGKQHSHCLPSLSTTSTLSGLVTKLKNCSFRAILRVWFRFVPTMSSQLDV